MSVDVALAAREDERPRVALIFALSIEGECFARHVRSVRDPLVSLHQCGPGAARAAAVAEAAVAAGAGALLSAGMAGGLEPGLAPGSIVLPRAVVRPDGAVFATDAPWRARLRAALARGFAVSEGALLAADGVLEEPESKASAAAATGAVAVDLESGAVAAAAARAGVPFVALRVIVDGAADRLPAGVERWIDERGHRRLAPVAGAVLRPTQWACLLTLGARYRAARRTLDLVSRELAPQGFMFPERRMRQNGPTSA